MAKFLESIAEKILESGQTDLSGYRIILPGKRAGQELKKIIASKLNKAHWAPITGTLPELVTELTSCTLASRIQQTIMLFSCYRSLGNRSAESFEDFIKWGNTVLNDFSDIEHYLAKPEEVFSDLRKIQDIQNWSFNNDNLSPGQINYLAFWNDLGELYQRFQQWQQSTQKYTYSGVLKEVAGDRIQLLLPKDCKEITFAGNINFSAAEQKFIEKISSKIPVSVYWDADPYYLGDPINEAGALIRSASTNSHHIISPEEGLSNSHKKFYFNETVTPAAQAMAAASDLSRMTLEQQNDSAIVIADNNLAEPLLHSLRKEETKIRMAYAFPLNQTKACKLLYQIFSILSRTEKSNTGIYYKDFEELLNYLDIRGTRTNDNSAINKYLVQNVIIYLSKNHLKKLSAEYDSVKQIIELTSHDDALNKIEMLAEWFRTMPDLDQIPDHEKSAIKIIEEIFVQLRELLTQFPDIANFHSIEALWFHLMNKEYLTLESENTEGIKITDLNETLAFDFKNIFVLGANEENIPGNSFTQTLIPFDLRAVYKLPLPQIKDAAQAYMFYRAIQRAQNIHLYYSTISSDYKGTEKSRFLSQIQFELQLRNKSIEIINRQLRLPEPDHSVSNKIKTNDWIKTRLDELFERGISPSAINKFNACPLDFYHRYILGLGEDDAMEEDLSSATIGSIVHKVLEDFYGQFIGKYPAAGDFQKLEDQLKQVIEEAFRTEYSETGSPTGFNLLATHVIENMLESYIRFEKKRIEQMDSDSLSRKIIAVEMPLTYTVPTDTHPRKSTFKLYGLADRVEEIAGRHYILDYKTGKVEKKDIEIPVEIEKVFDENASSKLIQMICYIYMYSRQSVSPENCQTAFYSFRFHSQGWMNVIKKDRTEISEDVLMQFENVLLGWREKVYSTEVFEHNPKSEFCQFCQSHQSAE